MAISKLYWESIYWQDGVFVLNQPTEVPRYSWHVRGLPSYSVLSVWRQLDSVSFRDYDLDPL